jgi:nucleoside-diphosphate-sugar epimerase
MDRLGPTPSPGNSLRKRVRPFYPPGKGADIHRVKVIPIVSDPANTDLWKTLLATVDAVIDAIGGEETSKLAPAIFNAVSEAAAAVRPPNATKLTFIQTSGTWVHGDNRDETVTDTTPAKADNSLIAWRVEHEQVVIASQTLNGIIIRPSMLYGRSASILGSLFKQAYDGEVAWYGTPGGRYALIHQDDLADLYVKVVERASILPGLIVDASNDSTESVDDILATLVKVSGAKGYRYVTPSNRKFVHVIQRYPIMTKICVA